MSLAIVDLPDPVAPMIAVVFPASAVNEMCSTAGADASRYVNVTSLNSISAPKGAPSRESSASRGFSGSVMVGSHSMTSSTRSAATFARGSMMEIMPIMRNPMMMTIA